MSIFKNLSTDDRSIVLSLLSPEQFVFIQQVVLALCNKNANAHLPKVQPSSKCASNLEIVGWISSEPFPMTDLVETANVLDRLGYHLLPIENVNAPCQHCESDYVVSMVYICGNVTGHEYAYELCLSCYMAFEQMPVYKKVVQ